MFALLALVVVLACAGGLLFWGLNAGPRTLAWGAATELLTQTVAPSGGTVTVQSPGSEIDGLVIAVPAGAYGKETHFDVSTRPITKHRFGDLFDPITPLITVDNGHGFAAEPMTVEIPIQLGPDEFAMAFFFDRRTGELEGIPTLALTADRLTLVTSHFSDLVVSKVRLDKLGNLTVDTGFAPGVDDWQFTNYGSIIARGGHCAGQSISMMWYYYERRLGAGERPLYGRYDNNNYGYGTIDFQKDDSWGYRLASVVQRSVDWDAHSRTLFKALGWASDSLTWNSFVYSMALTGEPQYVAIGRYVKNQEGQDVRRGHAIVAYRIEGGNLYVADPNYPGRADRYIRYENGAFLSYASGDNARDIAAQGARVYSEIRYMAKSAMVDWDEIGKHYDQMLEGKVGEDYFPSHVLSVLRFDPAAKEMAWQTEPEVIEIDEAETAQGGEQFRGKLRFGIAMAPNSKFYVTLYDATTKIDDKMADASGRVVFDVPLTPGVHDFGFYVYHVRSQEINGQQVNLVYDNDFRRVKVIYERPDLSGVWEGTYRVREASNARNYIQDVLVRILLVTGLADTESQAREIAAEAVVESPDLYDDRPIRITLEAIDPEKLDRYRATVQTVADDGTLSEEKTEATFEMGVFEIAFKTADGSKMSFSGQLDGKDRLLGTFDINAWGIVKNAIRGEWEIERQ